MSREKDWTSTHAGVALNPSKVTVDSKRTTMTNMSLVMPSFLASPIVKGLIFSSLLSALSKHS